MESKEWFEEMFNFFKKTKCRDDVKLKTNLIILYFKLRINVFILITKTTEKKKRKKINK